MASDMSTTLTDGAATLAGLLARATATLAGAHIEDARREAEALLVAALGMDRAAIHAYPERRVAGPELARIEDWLARRARGEPLAYLAGAREFWSLRIAVTPDVLVPRPETEALVAQVLALGDALGDARIAARSDARSGAPGPHRGAARTVVDLGTGSGCIALAIAHDRPAWHVTATDASPAALAVARGNATALGLARIEFVEGRWFAPLAGRRFDLVASNPPYVAAGDPALDDPALRHEPRMALTPEGDGYAALRTLIDDAPAHLRAGGSIVLEHGAGQGPRVAEMLVARGFRHVRCAPDLAGRDRVTSAQWPHSQAGLP